MAVRDRRSSCAGCSSSTRPKQDDGAMPTTKRPPLSQECIEARIVLRVAQLRELAAWTACEYWRAQERRYCRSEWHSTPPSTACANSTGSLSTARKIKETAGRRPGRWPDPSHVAGASIPVSERARLPVARHVDSATASEQQTTNLGVRSSNLFGRAKIYHKMRCLKVLRGPIAAGAGFVSVVGP